VTAASLPEDGPAEVAGVSLPVGQRIYGWMDDDADLEIPAAWVTSQLMADAAEHLAFADEYGRYSGQPISELAADLAGAPVWHFWWD